MIILRRILAITIDLIIFVFTLLPGAGYFDSLVGFVFGLSDLEVFSKQYNLIFVISYSIFYWFFLEVVFKCSIGKWIFKLRFYNYSGSSLRHAILYRNLLRFAVFISMIGVPIYLIIFITSKKCWYDKMIGIDVIIKDHGLTDVQKNWRKHFK